MNFKFPKVFGLIMVLFIISLLGWNIYDFNQEGDNSTILPTPKKKVAPLSFAIGGDAMLGRAVAWQFDNDVKLAFENLGENYFSGVDLGLVNLEGPISAEDFPANPTADNLIFNFPPQTIDALKYLGSNAVSLGNNHSQNQGQTGLENTRAMLKTADIASIGSQTTFNDNSLVRFGSGSKKLSVLTINCLETDTDITSAIKAEKTSGHFVLVFPHWGSEYQINHNTNQEELAHEWIDSGADMIIGSHPHVIQDAEIYQNKPIFYSLGNLVFDQPFSVETQRGLILKGEISDQNIKIQVLPTKIVKNRVSLLEGEEKNEALSRFETDLGSDNFQGGFFTIK